MRGQQGENSKMNHKGLKLPRGINGFGRIPPCPPPPPPPLIPEYATMKIDGEEIQCCASDLSLVRFLGKGTFGYVEMMKHNPSGKTMAVKRVPSSSDHEQQKQVLMDLDVSTRSADSPYTADFYGALFCQGDIWICMEVMDASLEKFYKRAFFNGRPIPEDAVCIMAHAVVNGLHYLAKELKVMHRDVKPSNILVDRQGLVKLCDFGISGHLKNSVARTLVGCKPYMAPEKIAPCGFSDFDVRSDVWSLGITVMEVAMGEYPIEGNMKDPFSWIKKIVQDPSPTLPPGRFSPQFEEFIGACLQKKYEDRPKYPALIEFAFLQRRPTLDFNMEAFASEVLSLPDPPIAQS